MKKEENLFTGIFEGINSAIKVAGELGKFAEDTFKKFYVENRDTFQALHKILSEITPEEIRENAAKVNEELNLCMVELGYPPVSDLNVDDFFELYETKEEKGVEYVKKYIDDFMISRFNEKEILKICNEWCRYSWIEDRKPILKEAISAHNMQMYNVSIPTLLAQCEGIIAVAFEHKGKMNHKNYNNKSKQPENSLEDYLNIMISEVGEGSFAIGVKEFYLRYMLVGFWHGHKIKSPLSRNAILHGGDTKYGSVSNSLKAILMFNELLITLNSVREKKEQQAIHM